MCLAGVSVTRSALGTCLAIKAPAAGVVVVSLSPTTTSVGTLIRARASVASYAIIPSIPLARTSGRPCGMNLAAKSSWPRVSLPENEDLCVDRCAEPLK